MPREVTLLGGYDFAVTEVELGSGGEIRLVLGGARSGKSEAAEQMAEATGTPVTYVATAPREPDDPKWEARIEAHRGRRPEHWETAELHRGGTLGALVTGIVGTVLVDSLGAWVSGLPDFGSQPSTDALIDALQRRPGSTIVVSEEVGMGVSPATAIGGDFRDALGVLNRRVADVADEVILVVAGRRLSL